MCLEKYCLQLWTFLHMSLKCIVFLYVIKYIIVNDCFVICVGSSLLSKTVDVTLKPMDFIAMDLIGEFHLPSSQGHRYALTRVCMLTRFNWCIPIKSKKAADVARAYMQHVYSVLGGSTKILTDNGTTFKKEVFRDMLQKLGTEKLIHSPPYRPQSNGRIEGFHRYLKACIAKHMTNGLEWDQITAMATATYNYFPNMSAKESAFFLTLSIR